MLDLDERWHKTKLPSWIQADCHLRVASKLENGRTKGSSERRRRQGLPFGTRCFSGQIVEGAGPAHIGVSGSILQSTILASREEMVNLRGVGVQDAMREVVDRG